MSYGRQINPRNIKIVSKLPHKNIVFTAPSNDCVSTGNRAGKWVTIPNAIDFNHYDLKNDIGIDAPLIFLGRIERVKGCHIAIEVAKKSGNKLIIAGNISDLTEEYEYYKKEIEPHIDDEQIKYVGMVNDKQKNHYLGISKALLFPINVREAFGMVMIEAMACGTPVIGFAMGSVPEIIEEGISGFVVKDADGIIEALDKIGEINRSQCREAACSKYNVSIVAKEYLTIFNK
jgi:glycosyltransferase involved in cell wall biosynthesis